MSVQLSIENSIWWLKAEGMHSFCGALVSSTGQRPERAYAMARRPSVSNLRKKFFQQTDWGFRWNLTGSILAWFSSKFLKKISFMQNSGCHVNKLKKKSRFKLGGRYLIVYFLIFYRELSLLDCKLQKCISQGQYIPFLNVTSVAILVTLHCGM